MKRQNGSGETEKSLGAVLCIYVLFLTSYL